jgi:magnesium transporter
MNTEGSDTGTPFWIDLVDPSRERIAEVSGQCRLQVPTREALQEIETSSRLRGDEHALYLSMPLAAQQDDGALLPSPLGFILTPDLVVTVRFSDVQAFAHVKKRFQSAPPADAANAFAALIEELVDVGADRLEGFGATLARISTNIFQTNATADLSAKRVARQLREQLSAVGAAGDGLSQLRQTLLGLQRVVAFTRERAVGGLPAAVDKRLQTAAVDVVSLVDFELHLTDKSQFLLDAILGYITTEQNDIFRVLTIVSIAGIPPTLVASLYGMNFKMMPELNWPLGYPFALGLIVLSAALPLLWFKRRGWW